MPIISALRLYSQIEQLSAYEVSQLGLLTPNLMDFMTELPLVAIYPRVAFSGFNIPALTVLIS